MLRNRAIKGTASARIKKCRNIHTIHALYNAKLHYIVSSELRNPLKSTFSHIGIELASIKSYGKEVFDMGEVIMALLTGLLLTFVGIIALFRLNKDAKDTSRDDGPGE
jgi:hypothetical protein